MPTGFIPVGISLLECRPLACHAVALAKAKAENAVCRRGWPVSDREITSQQDGATSRVSGKRTHQRCQERAFFSTLNFLSESQRKIFFQIRHDVAQLCHHNRLANHFVDFELLVDANIFRRQVTR